MRASTGVTGELKESGIRALDVTLGVIAGASALCFLLAPAAQGVGLIGLNALVLIQTAAAGVIYVIALDLRSATRLGPRPMRGRFRPFRRGKLLLAEQDSVSSIPEWPRQRAVVRAPTYLREFTRQAKH